MNAKYKGDHGLQVSVTNVDMGVMRHIAQKIRDQWDQECATFLQEIQFTIRKMEAGQSITLISKPLTCEITMEKSEELIS